MKKTNVRLIKILLKNNGFCAPSALHSNPHLNK